MKKKLFLLLASCLLSLFPQRAEAQTDNFIASGSTSPYLILGRSLIWGGTGFGTIGQNFIFHPLDPNQGFCLFLFNNNPSNSHTFTVTVAQTGDPALQAYSGSTAHWTSVPTQTSFPATVLANSLIGINYKTTASAGIVISFTGNTTQAGNPDSVDAFTVQTSQSSCGTLATNSVQGPYQEGVNITANQQFPVLIGGVQAPETTSAVIPMAMGTQGPGGLVMDAKLCCSILGNVPAVASNISEVQGIHIGAVETATAQYMIPVGSWGTSQDKLIGGFTRNNYLEANTDWFQFAASSMPAFEVLGKVTNPGIAGTILEQISTNTMTLNVQLKTLTLSCSAACEIGVYRIAARGTTCTALTAQNLNLGNQNAVATPNAQDILENACATGPTLGTQFLDLNLQAGGVTVIDMSGFVNTHSATTAGGYVVETLAAITGVASASMTFTEPN